MDDARRKARILIEFGEQVRLLPRRACATAQGGLGAPANRGIRADGGETRGMRWIGRDLVAHKLVDFIRVSLPAKSNLAVLHCLNEQIQQLEKMVLKQARLKPEYQALLSVPGVGKILALAIMLETGDIHRFAIVGNFASYALASSQDISVTHEKRRRKR